MPDMVHSSGSRVMYKRSTDSQRAPSGYEDKHQANRLTSILLQSVISSMKETKIAHKG